MVRLLFPIMLSLPMGISGNVAIAVLAAAVFGIYLVVLLLATTHVARESARWLQPLPLEFWAYCRTVLGRPLLKQFQWSAIGGVFLISAGVSTPLVLRGIETWLSVVLAVSTIATSGAYQSRGTRLRQITAIAAIGLSEALREYLSLPCALLVSAWNLKRVRQHA
jgi:hypothetical protein